MRRLLILSGCYLPAYGFPALSGGTTVATGRVGGAPDIPLQDLAPKDLGPEQVHITGACPSQLVVSWSSTETSGLAQPSTVQFRQSGAHGWTTAMGAPGEVSSSLMNPRYPSAEGGCTGSKNYTDPACIYTSGTLHELPTRPQTTHEVRIQGAGWRRCP
jgi:hypothetical protein